MILMAVTMETAEQALKIHYLGVVANQLNTETNALYNKIKTSTQDVYGKEVRKMAPYGLNGGFGAGTETGALPTAGGNNYKQFVSTTKDLYGVIELSDKSIEASQNSVGAFVNLLNQELEGLMKASKFNFGRMLYGDGSGLLTLTGITSNSLTVNVASAQFLMEGQIIEIRATGAGDIITGGTARRIAAVDRTPSACKIILEGTTKVTTVATDEIYIQGSAGLELSGMGKIFSTADLYGVSRASNFWMVPKIYTSQGVISDIKIQRAIDYMEEIAGSVTDFIVCSSGVKRSYQEYMESTKRNVNTLDLQGGFKALSYNGTPLMSDKFEGAGNLRLLNTKDFTLHQMGDWRWMGSENGKILTQVAGYAKWQATLVKYAELMCDHPGGQAVLQGLTEDDGIS